MYRSTITTSFVIVAIATTLFLSEQANCQLFDQLLRNVRASPADEENSNSQIGVTRDRETGTIGVKIPIFYDMTRQGNNLGINVLSGLVKVERGEPAIRSGLTGPRPLSVRIFGIPVYERGTRINNFPESTQPEIETPINSRPVPEGPDGSVDPAV